jgi:hypothetical protein
VEGGGGGVGGGQNCFKTDEGIMTIYCITTLNLHPGSEEY